MVPHYMFPVGSIRRMSASNKSDRKALKLFAEGLTPQALSTYSLAAAAQEAHDETFEPPSSEEEKVLQEIWADIFMLPKASIGKLLGSSCDAVAHFITGVTSNFFNLGRRFHFCHQHGQLLPATWLLTLGE